MTKEELPSLISSAYSSGQGMIPGTTAENFAVFRGGYNCRHSAIPFRLTKREKERLEQEQQEEIDDQDAEREKNIQEVERSVEDGKKRIEQSEKKIKVKKSELNDGLFLSKRSKDINEAAIDVLQDNDGAIDVANEYNTVITLRNSTEGSVNGSRAFLKDLGRYPDLTPYNIGVYKRGVEGFCAVDNSFYSVKVLNKDVILPVSETKATGIGTKNALSPTLEDLEEFGKKPGYLYSKQKKALYKKAGGSKYYEQAKMTKEGKVKFWGISEAHNVTRKKNNVTPTITHESGHLIQNKYDPRGRLRDSSRKLMKAKMKEYNITTKDALTAYGETNESELYAESFAAYVHANDDFKKLNPNLYKWFEDLTFNVYGIDKKSIKIAK